MSNMVLASAGEFLFTRCAFQRLQKFLPADQLRGLQRYFGVGDFNLNLRLAFGVELIFTDNLAKLKLDSHPNDQRKFIDRSIDQFEENPPAELLMDILRESFSQLGLLMIYSKDAGSLTFIAIENAKDLLSESPPSGMITEEERNTALDYISEMQALSQNCRFTLDEDSVSEKLTQMGHTPRPGPGGSYFKDMNVVWLEILLNFHYLTRKGIDAFRLEFPAQWEDFVETITYGLGIEAYRIINNDQKNGLTTLGNRLRQIETKCGPFNLKPQSSIDETATSLLSGIGIEPSFLWREWTKALYWLAGESVFNKTRDRLKIWGNTSCLADPNKPELTQRISLGTYHSVDEVLNDFHAVLINRKI